MKKQFNLLRRIFSLGFVMLVFLLCTSGCAKTPTETPSDISESVPEIHSLFGEATSEDFSSVPDISIEEEATSSEPPIAPPAKIETPALSAHHSEIRGVWFSYIEWGTYLRGKNEKAFTKSIDNIFSAMKAKKLNTFVVHTRSFGDAYYKSAYYPWSSYASGTLGSSPGFDPLSIICDRANAAGISVAAWVNPMRTLTDDEYAALDDSFQIKKWYSSAERYQYMYKDVATGKWILMPTNPAVAEHIANGAKEIAQNYAVASVHIDDYFYVSCIGTNPDAQYYSEQNPGMSIEDWRRDGTSKMVAAMYAGVKSANGNVLFEASPQANIGNNFNSQFIDVKKWLASNGYVDRIIPQIYFGFNNSAKPFDKTVSEWNGLIKNNTKLLTGLAPYKSNKTDNYAGAGVNEWIDDYNGANDIFKRQIECSRRAGNYGGFYFYSFKSIFNADLSDSEILKKNMDNILLIL